MKAHLLLSERHQLSPDAFVELRIWQVPTPVRASAHHYKYTFAYVVNEVCVLRYDNEAGKGDHRHAGALEVPYQFTTVDQLPEDFWHDVDQWRPA
jgi:hypothetical protein